MEPFCRVVCFPLDVFGLPPGPIRIEPSETCTAPEVPPSNPGTSYSREDPALSFLFRFFLLSLSGYISIVLDLPFYLLVLS